MPRDFCFPNWVWVCVCVVSFLGHDFLNDNSVERMHRNKFENWLHVISHEFGAFIFIFIQNGFIIFFFWFIGSVINFEFTWKLEGSCDHMFTEFEERYAKFMFIVTCETQRTWTILRLWRNKCSHFYPSGCDCVFEFIWMSIRVGW